MTDDPIKKIFDSYTPELSPDADFMAALRRRLDTVEELRAELAAERRRSRRALVWATLAGMVAGAVLMTLLPSLAALCTIPAPYTTAAGWLLTAAGASLASLASFDYVRGRVAR